MNKSAWQPILEGEVAERARASVHAIAQSVANLSPEAQAEVRFCERVLFWAYVAGALDDEFIQAQYDKDMQSLIDVIGAVSGPPALYGNLLSPWVLAHVSASDTEGLDAVLHAFDQYVVKTVKVDHWAGDYDLIVGLVGFGIYLLDRLETIMQGTDGANSESHSVVIEGLGLIVGHFEKNVEWSEQGATWHTAPELLPEHQRRYAPKGYYNVGLAHGVPGVIGFLGRLATTQAWTPQAATLLNGAVKWTLAQTMVNQASLFPSQIVPGMAHGGSRTAWCYGDPGVLCALWIAAKNTGQPTDDIEAMALVCANRDMALCGVRDSALCHGSVGLGHIYNRFFQASGNPAFREAAVRWFEHGMAQQGVEGIGGYLQWAPGVGETSGWKPSAGFLDGAMGVALGLLAALGDEVPGWDRLLLCDIPTG